MLLHERKLANRALRDGLRRVGGQAREQLGYTGDVVTQRSAARVTKPKRQQPKRSLTLAERIAAIGSTIPPRERATIPTDLARNLDHYLYGAPRKG